MNLKILEVLRFVYSYAPEINNWKILKRELLKCLPIQDRATFSRYDPKLKKIELNSLEQEIVDTWKKLTQKDLYLEERQNESDNSS